MANPAITLTCADYPRLMPLASGAVRPEGVDLTLVLGHDGSWGARAEMLSRALTDPQVHGGEGSMARQLRRIEQGDRSYVALPAFPLRNLTARDIYVRKDGTVRSAADLTGKRVGMYSWSASGSIWYRHMLRFLGVEPESFTWFIGDIDNSEWSISETGMPDFVHTPPKGRSLAQMLVEGELDALLSPPRPQRYHPKTGPIVRLIPEFRAIEQDYLRKFNIWPPQHLILLRRDAWLANKSIARSITDAFVRNNAVFAATQRSFPYASPWMDIDLDEAEALMGADGHADGLDVNRPAMEVFCEQAHRAGITRRRVSVDEYFAEYLES
jgi:4,5-dihydroxyphthalate decarboxylase